MSDETRPDEERSPAEERVLALLAFLRAEAERDDATLVRNVMRNIQFQRTLREALAALGSLAGAVADGVAAILGLPRRPGGRSA